MGAKVSTSRPEKQGDSVIKDTEVGVLCSATHFQCDFHQFFLSCQQLVLGIRELQRKSERAGH